MKQLLAASALAVSAIGGGLLLSASAAVAATYQPDAMIKIGNGPDVVRARLEIVV